MSEKENLKLSARIVRIEHDLLRIILWTLYFPFPALDYIASHIYHTWRKPMGFMNRFFHIGDSLMTHYLIGVNGIKK
jgi:hypothetical protein